MNLQKLAYASSAMSAAVLSMIAMVLVYTSAIDVLLDPTLESGWKVLLICLFILWVIATAFCVLIVVLSLIIAGDDNVTSSTPSGGSTLPPDHSGVQSSQPRRPAG